jgi:DNA-binding NarL/FixJ family response regulator
MRSTVTQRQPVRVVVVDNAELVRRGVVDVLGRDERFDVAAQIERPSDVVSAAARWAPQLIVFGVERDIDDTTAQSLAFLRRALAAGPRTRAIVLLDDASPDTVLQAVRSGARAVPRRDAPAGILLAAIGQTLEGGAALDSSTSRALFDCLTAGGEARGLADHAFDIETISNLSPREKEVLRALARGYRNKEIAAALGVSVGTIKTHLRHIFRKIRVNDRTGALLVVLRGRLPDAA